jgi:hypothetical protein
MEETPEVKLPKNTKENRYYYRHREEVLERKRQKRMEDPEYQAKIKAREEAKIAREAAKKAKEEAKEEKRKIVESLFLKVPGAEV